MTRSPAITDRTDRASSATGASFTRKPAAPTSMARRRNPGRPNVVRTTARQSGSARAERAGGLDPVASGHLDVEERHVGPELLGSRYDGVAATDFRDDLDVIHELEKGAQGTADQRLVLGDEDTGVVTRATVWPTGGS
jgi:hypothetical protein